MRIDMLIKNKIDKDKIILFLKALVLYSVCFLILAAPFSKRFVKIFFCLGTFTWIGISILEYGKNFWKNLIPNTPLNKPLVFFLAAAVLSVIFSLDPYLSQRIFFERYILYAIFFWVCYSAIGYSKRNIFFIVLFLLISGIVIGLGGVKDYIVLRPNRLYTVFNHDLAISDYMIILLPFSIVLLSSNVKGVLKYLSLFCVLLLPPVFVLNASRGVWVSVVLFLLVFFLLRRKLLILIFTLFVLSMFFMPNNILVRARSIFNSESLSDRPHLAYSAIKIFSEHPLFGAGQGMYGVLFQPQPGYENAPGYQHFHAHNTFLEIAAEMGIVGLAAFLSILYVCMRKFINKWVVWSKNDGKVNIISTAAGGSILACLLYNLFLSAIMVGFRSALLFWMMLAIAANDKVDSFFNLDVKMMGNIKQ
jgi:putative inorganic carbon (hco3(-)) transporter